MRPVQRDELVDWVTFSEQRPHRIAGMMLAKAKRRIHLGEWLTFLFENRDSVRWQVQEMLRIERIVREADIRHELDTYNELLGAAGELGATLLIETVEHAPTDPPSQANAALGHLLLGSEKAEWECKGTCAIFR